MKTKYLISAILLIITATTQASEPYWITETSSVDDIIAALRLPPSGKIYRDIVDIVDKHPKVAMQINFAYDSSKLNKPAKKLLNKLGRIFIGYLSTADFILAGHTDSTGRSSYNLGLSQRRATSVQNYLITKYYIPESRLLLKAYGEHKPIASNLTAEGRAKNRRVEFIRVK